MQVTLSLIRKEALQITRDPSAIAIAFVLPMLLLFIFGYGISLDSGRIKVGVVTGGGGRETLSLFSAFERSRFFEARGGTDMRDFADDLASGRLKGIVVVPQDLAGSLLAGRQATVQMIADGTEINSATFLRNYALGALDGWAAQERLDRAAKGDSLIAVNPRYWYNEELSSRNFIIPGSLSIVMTLIGVLLTALVIAREWERGTMESLMSTPVTIREIIVAKLATYYALALISTFICLAVAVLWYRVPFRGGAFALWAVSSVFLASALGQGLLISTLARDQYLASQAALVSGFLPSFFLSGFIFEISSMPEPIQAVSRLVAARYFVGSLQTVFLTGDVWPLFLRSMAAMAAIALAFLLLISRKMVKRVA
ncbi:MAG: ABC transporter permease [Deltaproteobacteria bacterium]|nr:ABC transporter permease [Deltaproteobacteria bacterium]